MKLKTVRTDIRPKGTVKCGNKRCQVCDYLCPGDTFTSKTTGRNFSINYKLNCNSNNVVFFMCCKVCSFQYVGSTLTKFRLRFNNQKSRLRAHVKLSDCNEERDDLLYKQFEEGQWAYRLRHLKPHGLNESDFSFNQNRATRVKGS